MGRKQVRLGTFTTAREAALEHDDAARKLGRLHTLNFPRLSRPEPPARAILSLDNLILSPILHDGRHSVAPVGLYTDSTAWNRPLRPC
eukprot:1180508-Prorocentrum_minimum.AAC.1